MHHPKTFPENIRCVVLDLDGTFLNSSGAVDEESLPLLAKLNSKLVRFVFASGRQIKSIKSVLAPISIPYYIIAYDGSLVKKPYDDSTLFESLLSKRFVNRAIKFAKSNNSAAGLFTQDGIICSEESFTLLALSARFAGDLIRTENLKEYYGKAHGIVLAGKRHDALEYFANGCKMPFSVGLEPRFYKSTSIEGQFYCEVRKKGSSKATALMKILKYAGIETEKVLVAGDWYNDISLFRTKAYKVAFLNSIPELRDKADLVLEKSNSEKAVIELLELIMKNKNL